MKFMHVKAAIDAEAAILKDDRAETRLGLEGGLARNCEAYRFRIHENQSSFVGTKKFKMRERTTTSLYSRNAFYVALRMRARKLQLFS